MSGGTISCLAWCTKCEWREENYKTARQKAYDHARRTGHVVEGEQVISFYYAGRSEKPREA